MIRTRNKVTGGTIEFWETPIEKCDEIVRKATDAFSQWKYVPVKEKRKLYKNLKAILKKQEETITQVIRGETGKPIHDFLFGEMVPIYNLIKFLTRKEVVEFLEKGEKVWANSLFAHRKKRIMYSPIGVVGVISSWNFPFGLAMGDALEALIGGNTVILKHSSYTPLTSLLIKSLLEQAEFPKNVFQVVIGPGEKVGEFLAGASDAIALTGGEKAGKRIREIARQRELRYVELELGGSNPAIVLQGANLERAANAVIWGRNMNAGQACNSIKRVYVESVIYEDFVALIRKKILQLKSEIDYGQIIHKRELDKLLEFIHDAQDKGAIVDAGGEVLEINGNFYLTPTLLINTDHFMRVMKEEVFGPILPVIKVRDYKEALEMANDSPFGLGASIFAKKRDARVEYLRKELQVGVININSVMDEFAQVGLPFVGRKASGWGSGRHSLEGVKRFLVAKGITIDSGILNKELHWYPYSDKQIKLYRIFSKLGLI